MRQLSSLDAQFLALESDRNYGHVGSVAILDPSTAPGGKVTIEDVRRLLSERLHLIPPFTLRLAEVPLGLDLPYWVPDDHFDLGYHCREIALPPPGSTAQLAEQVARIYSRRLDRSRPLWELYLIHGLPDGRVALLTKIHHAAVDGMSGGEILTLLYDLAPEGREVEPPGDDEPAAGGAPGTAGMLLRGLAALPRYPVTVAGRVGDAAAPRGRARLAARRARHPHGQPHALAGAEAREPGRPRRGDRTPGDSRAQGPLRRATVTAPDLRVRVGLAGGREAGEEPLRGEGERRGGVAGGGRRAGAPHAPRRAARGARWWPRSRCPCARRRSAARSEIRCRSWPWPCPPTSPTPWSGSSTRTRCSPRPRSATTRCPRRRCAT